MITKMLMDIKNFSLILLSFNFHAEKARSRGQEITLVSIEDYFASGESTSKPSLVFIHTYTWARVALRAILFVNKKKHF